MEEYDYNYDSKRRGPGFPLGKVHNTESMAHVLGPLFWLVLGLILFSLLGCAGLENMTSDEVVGVVAKEVAEAAPIVASNPTFPGVLTAVISVIAGVAGAAFGAAGGKVSVKNKISKGVLGKHAAEKVESL